MSHPSGKIRSKRAEPKHAERARPDDYLEAFLDLLPPREIQRIARETGFVQRHRKLDPVAFLYTLAFESGPQLQRTVEALRDAYNERTPSSAWGGCTSGSRPGSSRSFGAVSP